MCSIEATKQLAALQGDRFFRETIEFPTVMAAILRSYEECVKYAGTELCYCSRLDEPAGASASCSLFLRFLQKELCSGDDSPASLWSLLSQLLAIGLPDFSLQPLPANSPAPLVLSPAGKGPDAADWGDATTPLSPAEHDEAAAKGGIPAGNRGDQGDRMWQVKFPRGCDV